MRLCACVTTHPPSARHNRKDYELPVQEMRFAARDEKGSSHHADRLNETGKIAALLRRQLEDEDTDRKGNDTATCRAIE